MVFEPKTHSIVSRSAAAIVVTATLLITVSCSRTSSGATTVPLLQVPVVEVKQADVPVYKEWIGTLEGYVNADIKAQVTGYLIEQAYTEGSFVRKGQLLFQIDPRPFQATLDQSEGLLAQSKGELEQARAQLVTAQARVAVAEADQRKSQLDVNRYKPLIQQQAITQQDFDNATQNNMAATAQVDAAKAEVQTAQAQIVAAAAAVQTAQANVETAKINLGFTRITAPIDGIPGIAQLQVGALVSPASGPITTMSTLDPIKVYFTVSEQEYLDFARRYPTQRERLQQIGERQLDLILADGSTYQRKGRISFADRQVDERTGAIRLVGLFPNPDQTLRPGQYGRVRTASRIEHGALLVPQRAVYDLQGIHQIAVVEAGGTVRIKPVTLGDTVGNDWLVRDGLNVGDRVIVEGVQKVRQGMHVNALPYEGR